MHESTRLQGLARAGVGLWRVGTLDLVRAAGLLEVDQVIFGMDCAPCAYGVEQGLRKLQGVQKVTVSLNQGKAVVVFAPDSPTSLKQIRKTIRKNGFTPKDAMVHVAGRLAREGDALLLAAGTVATGLRPPQMARLGSGFVSCRSQAVSSSPRACPRGRTTHCTCW